MLCPVSGETHGADQLDRSRSPALRAGDHEKSGALGRTDLRSVRQDPARSGFCLRRPGRSSASALRTRPPTLRRSTPTVSSRSTAPEASTTANRLSMRPGSTRSIRSPAKPWCMSAPGSATTPRSSRPSWRRGPGLRLRGRRTLPRRRPQPRTSQVRHRPREIGARREAAGRRRHLCQRRRARAGRRMAARAQAAREVDFPWQPVEQWGPAVLVTRRERAFSAQPIMTVGFIPCTGQGKAQVAEMTEAGIAETRSSGSPPTARRTRAPP